MPEASKQEKVIKFKIKSAVIKNGWYILYSILFPLFFALMFQNPWLMFAAAIMAYPIYLMVVDIKKLKKELRELREALAKEQQAAPEE